jgi:hypothetical protein
MDEEDKQRTEILNPRTILHYKELIAFSRKLVSLE